MANACAPLAKVFHVAGVEAFEDFPDLRVQFGLAEKVTKPLRGHGEAVWNLHSLAGQFAEHFAQGRVLAAHQRNVLDSDLAKPFDEAPTCFGCGFRFRDAAKLAT